MAGRGPDPDRIVEAMMNDLGRDRMEELAKDDGRDGRRLRFPMQSIHGPAKPPEQQPQAPRTLKNEAAKGWNIAVSSGAFRDDDSRGVDGLDTIADGRLHALNKAQREGSGRTGRHGGYPAHNIGFDFNQAPSWKEMKESNGATGDSRYDPMNPNKLKPIKGHNRDPESSTVDESSAIVTPMGALQGHDPVKKWNSFKPAVSSGRKTSTATAALPEPSLDVKASTETRGAVTNGPRRSFAPHGPQPPLEQKANGVNHTAGENPEHFSTHSSQSPSTAILPHLRTKPAHLSPNPSENDRRGGLQVAESDSKPPTHYTIAPVGTISSVPPHLRSPSPAVKSPTSPLETKSKMPPHTRPLSPVASNAPPLLPHQRTASRAVSTATLTLLPHARGSSTAVSRTPKNTGQVQGSSTVPNNPSVSQPEPQAALAPGLQVSQPEPTDMDASQLTLFYDADVMAARTNKKTGIVDVIPGRMFIYQYPGKEVAIWELRWSDGYVIREDVRAFVPPFNQMSRIIVRRQDRPDEVLRTTQVRVNIMALGAKFLEVYKKLKKRSEASSAPRYPYTEEQENPTNENGIDISTLIPLGSSLQENEIQSSISADKKIPAEILRPESPKRPVHATSKLTGSESQKESRRSPPRLNPEDDVLGDMIQDLHQQDTVKAQQQIRRKEEAPKTRQAGVETLKGNDEDARERNHIKARRAQLEADLATSARPTEVLIDMSPPSPPFQATASAADLEGIIYEQRPDTKPAVEASPPQLAEPIVKEEPTEVVIKSEPDRSPEPALMSAGSQSHGSQQAAQADANENSVINAAKLAEVPIGVGLTRKSQAIIAQLNVNHYRELSVAFDETLYWVKQTGPYGSGSVYDNVAVQVTLIHLARHTSFKELGNLDRIMTAAVVFSNLKQLKTRRRIKYTLSQLFSLRDYARPVHPAVILANDYMKLAREREDTRRSRTQHSVSPTPSSARELLSASPHPPSEQHRQASHTPDPPKSTFTLSPSPSSNIMGESTVPRTPAEVDSRSTTTSGAVVLTDEMVYSSNNRTDAAEEAIRPLPPHLRGVGHKTRLGNSRWA
ncbi:hypothetical protein SCUP234_10883 [Seiridium cupressi]